MKSIVLWLVECSPIGSHSKLAAVHIEVKHRIDQGDRSEIEALLDRCLSADGHHPLSDHAWLDLVHGGRPGFAALVAYEPGHEHPVGYAQVSCLPEIRDWSLDVVIDPHHRFDGAGIADLLIGDSVAIVASEGGGSLRYWVSHPSTTHDTLAAKHGLLPERDLLQLRVPFPLPDEIVEKNRDFVTRPFVVGADEAAWLEVNNRAFDWHPEQGGWTLDVLQRRELEPWFEPAGFLLHERDGVLAGSCWTKVHFDLDPVLGEIYVIAVDPTFHGLGLGRALTVAGLQSMAQRGVPMGMLYVESTNVAALRLYESLGFRRHHINRAYRGDIGNPFDS